RRDRPSFPTRRSSDLTSCGPSCTADAPMPPANPGRAVGFGCGSTLIERVYHRLAGRPGRVPDGTSTPSPATAERAGVGRAAAERSGAERAMAERDEAVCAAAERDEAACAAAEPPALRCAAPARRPPARPP